MLAARSHPRVVWPIEREAELAKLRAQVEIARCTYAVPAEQSAASEIARQRRARFDVVVIATLALALAIVIAWRPEAAPTIEFIALALSVAWVIHSAVALGIGIRAPKPPAPPASAGP